MKGLLDLFSKVKELLEERKTVSRSTILEMRQFLKGRDISQSIMELKVFILSSKNMATCSRFSQRGRNINFQK